MSARDRQADKVWLPFDDDAVMSIVLSKAFLLAADAAITDETIRAQIGRWRRASAGARRSGASRRSPRGR